MGNLNRMEDKHHLMKDRHLPTEDKHLPMEDKSHMMAKEELSWPLPSLRLDVPPACSTWL